MTVLEILNRTIPFFQSKGIETARLDAEVLLGEVLGISRVQLYVQFDRPLENNEIDAYRELVKKRSRRIPIAYLLGRREFYSRDFKVTPGVLIPRPETELLVELALERLTCGRVLDLGVGPGTIALTLAAERPDLRVVGVDISSVALHLAGENAETLGVAAQVELLLSDLFDGVQGRFQAILSNPPYIPQGEPLPPEVCHEPSEALFAGERGLDFYRRIAREGRRYLEPGGFLALEIGAGQARDVQGLLEACHWQGIQIHPDYAGIPRVIMAEGGESDV